MDRNEKFVFGVTMTHLYAGRAGLARAYLPSKNAGIVDFPAISRGCATSAQVFQYNANKTAKTGRQMQSK